MSTLDNLIEDLKRKIILKSLDMTNMSTIEAGELARDIAYEVLAEDLDISQAASEENIERGIIDRVENSDHLELVEAKTHTLKKTSKIKHLSNGKWRVTDESGKKNLGTSDSKAKAVKRLHQVEYFKNKKSEFVSKIMVVAGIENYTIKKIIVS
jgi:hypothetical protein